ncbi:hypothetical protein SAMN04490244_10252 [Tranquillimonas rosea]|uniref:Uncharacterized protein n=1 Tax=Tranquillimonas rosea TaxID=641238 RepID=A0A1H9QYP5_9RHOB|nr:hypothetical protein [Tranquillimonas rosea]SER65711.1 hypothetical protein SAMN04490244_10252 [Tranquillimonas rosea]
MKLIASISALCLAAAPALAGGLSPAAEEPAPVAPVTGQAALPAGAGGISPVVIGAGVATAALAAAVLADDDDDDDTETTTTE